MRKHFQRQLAIAKNETGEVDLDILADLVTAAYEEADRDRKRTDRSISLMAAEIEQTQGRLLDAFDVVPEGLFLLDAQGKYVIFNRKFLELNDTAAEKIAVGGSFADFIRAGVERGHYVDAIGREEEWISERLLRNKHENHSTEQRLRGDRWVRINERRTADGGCIGIQIDITDLKRREEILKRRSQRLVEAQRLAKSGDWSQSLVDGTIWWSLQIFELLVYDPTEFVLTHDAVMSVYIGDGAAKVLASQAEVMRSGGISSADVKVKRGDGTIADVVVTSGLMNDDAGRVIGFTGTIQDITERKIIEEKLEKLAYFDPLTGLANRPIFHRQMNDALSRCERMGSQAALFLLDLDRFKEINDSFGHVAGDELLTKVAQLISRQLGNKCFFSRLGGDEFAIVMQDFENRSDVERMAVDIIETIKLPIPLSCGDVNIGVSIGVAMIPGDGTN